MENKEINQLKDKEPTLKELKQLLKEEQEKYDQEVNRVQEIRELENKEHSKLKELENAKYEEFVNNIRSNNIQYFRIKQVDDLNLPYDILIFLSSKNSGKTWEQYRLIKDTIEKGRKFFYLRCLKREIEGLKLQFTVDSLCPVILVKSDSWYLLYSKEDWEFVKKQETKEEGLVPNPRKQLFDKYKIEHVGYAADMHTSNLVGGGEFPDVELVIFDECLGHHPNIKTKLEHCKQFRTFLSSVQRGKQALKVLCFGNLNNNTALLDFYNIGIADKFRYVPNFSPDSKEITGYVLFINSGGVYPQSLQAQKGAVQIGDARQTIALIRNEIAKGNRNIVADKFFKSTIAESFPYGFLVELNKHHYEVLVKYLEGDEDSEDEEQTKKVYGVQCRQVKEYFFEGPYRTNSEVLSHYSNVEYYEYLLDDLDPLFSEMSQKRLLFTDNSSFENFSHLYSD